MFDKILIANRGEIACRVIHTARRLGVRTVAVYSDADAGALHVDLADEAVLIGPAAASESYLNIDAVIDAAKRTGAQAVHPGYGFLSENAAFADACEAAGLVFIGPPADAIRAMGSKSEAKALMEKAGVPLVPGYHGESQDFKVLEDSARRIGYPVLIKASAGGGGRGMRIVERELDFRNALDSARRESKNAFGDDRMLIEKYLTRPRHVEIQVFADSHGNAVYLFERDCSVQRRHQKIIEEAPAPGLDESRRAEMGAAAVAAAEAIGYVGAGTVEFIMDEGGDFYFMEMNTRLQVEHPVTEMITGQDLVDWQLQVAAGGSLPLAQQDLAIDGHAFEARLYAEDPSRDFLPQTGTLQWLEFPVTGDHVRVDTGVRSGDEVSIHYDPMIAKLIVWDRDRDTALRRLCAALAETRIVGVTSNVPFLMAVAGHDAFAAGEVDTGFIARHHDDLFPAARTASNRVLGLAALYLLLKRGEGAAAQAAASSDPYSPWHRTDGWRLNDDNHHDMIFQDGERETKVTVHYRTRGYVMDFEDGQMAVQGHFTESGELAADFDGLRFRATVLRAGSTLTVIEPDGTHQLEFVDPMATVGEADAAGGGLAAPMPGKVIQVMVEAGATVRKGTPLLVLEAMKMEHTIAAPADGTVEAVYYRAGDQVAEGAELIAFKVEDG